jgi:hypothetical protein
LPASPLSCSPSGRFKTNQGIARLTAGEVATVAGETPDSHEMDLLQAMDHRDFPSWPLRVRIVPAGSVQEDGRAGQPSSPNVYLPAPP